MASQFPAAFDTFMTSQVSDTLATSPHHKLHNDANDALAAIQARLGVLNSVDATSVDYLLRHLQAGIAPMAHINNASTSITTTGINVSLATNYNLVSGVLGIANGLNDANTAQNALGIAYMALAVITLDLVNKFNTLSAGLQTQGLET